MCDKSFKGKRNLNKHYLSIHEEASIKSQYTISRQEVNARKFHQEENTKEQNKSESKIKSQPKKGMWLVKLERLKTTDFI